jgi:SAM-dependent methyltransferase
MMPGSKLYTDPDYLQWETMRASSHDYFYGSKGIISWVQASGHQAIARMMESKQYQAIVDLGCGDGAHYPYIKQTEKYVGVDIDQPTLERFKLKQPDCCLLRVNGFELPFKDKSVDCLINIYNLEHMMYLDIALEEMNRILTEQGDVYISVPNEGGFLWGLGRSLSSVKHYKNINYPRIIEIEHINCIWQLEKAFKRHFKIKKKEPFPFSLPGFHANIVTTYHCVKI